MDAQRYQAFTASLKQLLDNSDITASVQSVLQLLASYQDLLPLIPDPPFELFRQLHSITATFANALERTLQSEDTPVPEPTPLDLLLEAAVKLVEWLPLHLLDSQFQKPIDAIPHPITELKSDDLEPVGHRLLTAALLIPTHPIVRCLLRRLTDRLVTHPSSDCPIVTCILRFVEDIRAKGLTVWKAMRDSRDGTVLITPLKSRRLTEGRRLNGVAVLVQDKGIPDRIIDRLLPCALFVLDDYDSEVACYGAKTLMTMIGGTTHGRLLNWHDVIHRALSDRLLSCDVMLWKELLSLCLKFLVKFSEEGPKNKDRVLGTAAGRGVVDVLQTHPGMIIFEKILERLQMDLAPYVLAEAFCDRGPEWIAYLGSKLVRYFSKLFPVLIRWMMTGSLSLQLKALDSMQSVIKITSPRIQRHVRFLETVLDAIKAHSNGDVGGHLEKKLKETCACLNAIND